MAARLAKCVINDKQRQPVTPSDAPLREGFAAVLAKQPPEDLRQLETQHRICPAENERHGDDAGGQWRWLPRADGAAELANAARTSPSIPKSRSAFVSPPRRRARRSSARPPRATNVGSLRTRFPSSTRCARDRLNSRRLLPLHSASRSGGCGASVFRVGRVCSASFAVVMAYDVACTPEREPSPAAAPEDVAEPVVDDEPPGVLDEPPASHPETAPRHTESDTAIDWQRITEGLDGLMFPPARSTRSRSTALAACPGWPMATASGSLWAKSKGPTA
jgi:hypothetical protein